MRTTSLPIHMATTGKQLEKLQVYENKFVRRIARKPAKVERMEGERLTKRADAEWIIGRPTPRWEDCVKRDLARAGGVWRTRTRDTWRGDSGETGSVTKKKEKQKSTTGIGASLTLDFWMLCISMLHPMEHGGERTNCFLCANG